MSKDNGGQEVSLKRIQANRLNAQRSTGPRSEAGKLRSRRNALKHGILTSSLLIKEGPNLEDVKEFDDLLSCLQQDLVPEGMLEELLVEKIAICFWRQKRVLRCEAGMSVHDLKFALYKNSLFAGRPSDPVLLEFTEHLTLPLSDDLDRLLRYETSVHRQLVFAVNQLERLQRARKGEHIPAPVTVQISSDQ